MARSRRTAIRIGSEDLVPERAAARRLLVRRGVPALFAEIDPGDYGATHVGLWLLEALETGLAVAIEVAKHLDAILPTDDGPSARRQRFVNLFATMTACDAAAARTADLLETAVRAGNAFGEEGVAPLFAGAPGRLADRLLDDALGFVGHQRRATDPSRRVDSAGRLAASLHAWAQLMRRTVEGLAGDAAYRNLLERVEEAQVEVLDWRYRGLVGRPADGPDAHQPMPIAVEDIVGNQDYLAACLRTARDVAGFDFDAGRNPKTFSPVLFALGRPGSGKTVTAHAVARHFLDHCAAHDVPAAFRVIRRTDWASSYQNASAANLLAIFEEEIARPDRVVCVYWPDIDTAFAARENPGIRDEEKNILGACFGLFDGTLLPKNGQWFMMADANHLHMDEATVSRITQNPYRIDGARTIDEYVRLLRDVKLRDHLPHLDLTKTAWRRVGKACRDHDFSGRAVDDVSRRVVAAIEDFDPPAEYYAATFERRLEILAEGANTIAAADVLAVVESHARFAAESQAAADEDAFERRVEEIVRGLSAREAAARRWVDRS